MSKLFDLSPARSKLVPPCTYQGGKQRLASQIAGHIAETFGIGKDTRFYDICCGSGAVSLELMSHGLLPSNTVMLDAGSWGTFWEAIGSGDFSLPEFEERLFRVPDDQRDIKAYLDLLIQGPFDESEVKYLYPIFQASSFGGKQIYHDRDGWHHQGFRPYWEPRPGCVRTSHVNTMQPGKHHLLERVRAIVEHCQGVTGIHGRAETLLGMSIPDHALIYIDPPYSGTEGYAFDLDLADFLSKLSDKHSGPIFVSEGRPLSDDCIELAFCGAKGGISGNRKHKHREFLSRVQ